MALRWDKREIVGFEPGEDSEWVKAHGDWTEPVIWYVMFTGLGWQVTEDNIEEFVARIRTLEALPGGKITTEPIPEGEIRAHIGLKVNVSPEPRAAWLMRQFENAFPKTERLNDKKNHS